MLRIFAFINVNVTQVQHSDTHCIYIPNGVRDALDRLQTRINHQWVDVNWTSNWVLFFGAVTFRRGVTMSMWTTYKVALNVEQVIVESDLCVYLYSVIKYVYIELYTHTHFTHLHSIDLFREKSVNPKRVSQSIVVDRDFLRFACNLTNNLLSLWLNFLFLLALTNWVRATCQSYL